MLIDGWAARTVRIAGSALALGCVALGCVALGCGLPDGDYFGKVPEPDPTHLRWCNSGDPEHVDTALVTSTTGLPVAQALLDGLADHDMNGLPEPSLAARWEVSADQRTFTFFLRDDGRWSNGRPITSRDFAYHLARVLHPITSSRRAESVWRLKNAQRYTEGRVKEVLRDTGPFRAGDIVELIGLAGIYRDGAVQRLPALLDLPIANPADIDFPDTNLRTAPIPLPLRDLGANGPVGDAYATVPPNREVTIVELDDTRRWAYVHWADGDGVYGWVDRAALTGQPNGDIVYRVRRVPAPHRPGVDIAPGTLEAELAAEQITGAVRGADLLMHPGVLGIRTPDPHTLILETWGPTPYLTDMITQPTFRATPREAVSRQPLRWTRSPETFISSGPFRLAGWYERDRIELVRSATYWRRDQVQLERITVYSMDDQAATTNYYLQGGCDATTVNVIPASYLPAVNGSKRGRPYLDYTVAPYLGVYYYLINTEKLSNRHLRRALALAIDRRPLPSFLHGGQIPTAQATPGTPISQLSDADLALCGVTRDTPGVAMIVVTGQVCYVPPPGLDYDPDAARAELSQARKELGDAFPSSLTVKFNTGREGHKLIAEYMQRQWEQVLDLDVELASQEWKTFLSGTVAGEYQIARFGNIGNFPDPESEFNSVFRCGAPNNRVRWCDDEFERLYTQAESIIDRNVRLSYIRQAESLMVQDAAIIPLYVYAQHHLQKPYVRDLAINLPNQQALWRVWIDADWRARRRR